MKLQQYRLAFLFSFVLLASALGADHAAPSVGPDEALARLKAGNLRFARGSMSAGKPTAARRAETAKAQHPFAIIIGCADSRTAPEIVFDQNIGDLFVVRTAGALVDDYALGSIEYAVEHLGARLVVVLGHERCGAVQAALAGGEAPGHIHALVRAIEPAVEAVKGRSGDPLTNAIHENDTLVAEKIRKKARLGDLASQVRVVTGYYDLDTGKVEWPVTKSLRLGIAAALAFSTAGGAPKPTREEVLAATLAPYAGESVRGVDVSTLTGKVMCGYQGWFNCEGDGADRGWVHWVKGKGIPSPSNVKVDLWPDVSELGPDERFDTAFHHADGSVAQVFSSFKEATVLRHFQWMRDDGIDGVFVQRFATGVRSPDFQRHSNLVLAHCREGANRNGRAYALMYDLSGMPAGRMDDIIDDWRQLRARMKLGDDPAYLHHRGKPVVAVWGVGFNDQRAYTLDDCRHLLEFLKSDGCTVMLGVPTYWREQKNDAVADPALHEVLALANVVSPWTVGRYHTPEEAARYAEKLLKPDLAWCAEHRLDYLPVIFPGFSWRNVYGQDTGAIPRRRGEFFWRQFREAKNAGATMLYVAMFDEVDEGTAIFKCTNDAPPESEAPFVTYEGLPSDYYLRLTGQGAKMLRGELAPETPLPPP